MSKVSCATAGKHRRCLCEWRPLNDSRKKRKGIDTVIHQYQNNGYNIVLDVNSGAIHVVDELMYEVIGLYETHSPEQIKAQLAGKYDEAEIDEALSEIKELIGKKELFTPDEYEG